MMADSGEKVKGQNWKKQKITRKINILYKSNDDRRPCMGRSSFGFLAPRQDAARIGLVAPRAGSRPS